MNSPNWFAAAPNTTLRSMAQALIAAVPNGIRFRSMTIGRFPGAAKAGLSADCISSAVSAAAITSLSFSAK